MYCIDCNEIKTSKPQSITWGKAILVQATSLVCATLCAGRESVLIPKFDVYCNRQYDLHAYTHIRHRHSTNVYTFQPGKVLLNGIH